MKQILLIISTSLLALVILLGYSDYNLRKKLILMESAVERLKNEVGLLRAGSEYDKFPHGPSGVDETISDDNYKEFQKIIKDYVKKNINRLVPEKPAMGGRWNASSIYFMSPEIIEVVYEDGHNQGVLFFKIENAYDSNIMIKPFY